MKKQNSGFRNAGFAVLVFLTFAGFLPQKTSAVKPDLYKGIEFPMPKVKEPVIPSYTVKLTDFGAVRGGQELCTRAFAEAIRAVSQKGGGRIIIPAGIWLTGPVILKSNLELYTEPGAIVIFSTDKDLYPLIETSFEGLNTWRCISPIFGKDLENVAFTGKGVWDGSGDAWRFVKKSKLTEDQWKKLVASGGITNDRKTEWYPSEQFKNAMAKADMNVPSQLKTKAEFETIRDFLRPVMVSLVNCKQVLLDGPTFQNSPAWCIHPLMIENLTVRNITVKNPWYSQNGDGIDIESCKNVVLYDSHFDVGDDAICIKSGKDKAGRDRGIPSENIVIKNCVVYHGHGGVTVGSEMSGGVKNMHVSGCSFLGTDVGLRFKSNRGRGGIVENIYMSGIQMVQIPAQAISFDLYYMGRSAGEMTEESNLPSPAAEIPVTEETPVFRNISIRDITCKGAYQAVLLQGLPEMNLENILLENILMEADRGISCVDVNQLKINNFKLITKRSPSVEFTNSRNVSVTNLELTGNGENNITIGGKRTGNISLMGIPTASLEKITKIKPEVGKGEVKF